MVDNDFFEKWMEAAHRALPEPNSGPIKEIGERRTKWGGRW